jgi:hypothetical protein
MEQLLTAVQAKNTTLATAHAAQTATYAARAKRAQKKFPGAAARPQGPGRTRLSNFANSTSTRRYSERLAKFEESEAEIAKNEAGRIEDYNKLRYSLRILNLKAFNMHEEKESYFREIERVKVELDMEVKRGEQLVKMQGRSETVRAKQIMEHFRGPETIAHLQDQLAMAIEQRNRAMSLPESATTLLHRMELEETRTNMLRQLRMTIGRIREQLIEEGRRRKFLYEEEFGAAQQEVKMIREENAQAIERSNSLRVIEALTTLDLDTRQILTEAKVAEATDDKEGIGVTGTDGQEYAEDKEWSTPPVNAAIRELKEVQRCLGAALEARSLARAREARSRESGQKGNVVNLPPHADQWLPAAERTRMLEEIDFIKYFAGLNKGNAEEMLKNERLVVESLKGSIEVLQNKLTASELTRSNDVTTIRFTAEEAFLLLQKSLKDQQEESARRETRYEEAISELNKEFVVMKTQLQGEIEELNTEIVTLNSMTTVLR